MSCLVLFTFTPSCCLLLAELGVTVNSLCCDRLGGAAALNVDHLLQTELDVDRLLLTELDVDHLLLLSLAL